MPADERSASGSGSSVLGNRFDAMFVVLSILLMIGLAWDFRIHAAGVSFEEEGFFTIPHLIVYTAGVAIAALLGGVIIRNHRAGADWLDAIPVGYRLGLVGILLFGAAGVADFVWHTSISHEDTALEALVSPPHLGLAVGGVLFLSSPLRAAWRREGTPSGLGIVPALLSASFVLSIVVVFGTYTNPITATQILQDTPLGRIVGLGAMAVFPAALVGAMLALIRRFELPVGALTLMLFVPGMVSVGTHGIVELLLPMLAAGAVADALVAVAPPTLDRPLSVRAFGAVVPVAFAGTFFLVVELQWGIQWTTHLWTGAIAVAGLGGLLLTYAILPDGRRGPGA